MMAQAPTPGQLAQFFTLSHDLFCSVDLGGTFLQVNPAFLALLEFSEDAVIGRPYALVVSEEDQPLVANVLTRLAHGDVVEVFELQIVSASRRRHWVEVSASLGADGIIYVVARQITERKQLEAQLQHNQRLFHIAGDTALIGGWYVNLRDGLPIWSDEICRIHGVEPGYQPTIESAIAFYTPSSQARIRYVFAQCSEAGEGFDEELEILTRQGETRWVRVVGQAVRDESGRIVQVQGSTQDIQARKVAEGQLKLLERGVESSVNGIVIADARQPGMPIVYVNAAFERITGYSREEAMGRNCRFLQGDETDPQAVRVLHEAIDAERDVHLTLRNYRRNGALFWNDLYISPVRDESGVVTHFIGVQNDISEQREYQSQIDYNANHDALTGLPNRTLLAQRLAQGCQIAQRHQRYLAVLFIDLDDFKPINDTLGHEVGDFILVEVARRLEAVLRPWDTIARFGSDEFVAVLPDLADERDALYVVERILHRLASAYWHNGSEMRITASIGITTSDGKTDRPKTLIQEADLAMYKAKRQGRNTYQWYTEELNQKVSAHVALRSALQKAIEQEEFELHYQPQIHSPSGRVVGVEALIRWRHPERGYIPPGEFISLAEDRGQIIPISEWVLATACRDGQKLNTLGFGRTSMAVNISPMQFQRPGFLDSVEQTLKASAFDPTLLELELTEGVLMESAERAIGALYSLRQLGVHIAMDDFGTGFSSLSYLKRLPINKIKIDRSFVREVISDHRDAAIIEGVVTMAAKMELEVLVEGVETAAQHAFLRKQLCHTFQGFYFARPMPFDDLVRFVREQGPALPSETGTEGEIKPTLLLLDDEPNILSALTRVLRRDGYRIIAAERASDAFEYMAMNDVHVILSDQRMPEMSGTEFLRRAKELYPDTVQLILSGYTNLKTVTEAVNQGGVYKFITKPWDDDELRALVQEAFRHGEREQRRRGEVGPPPVA
ncbi:EAL domain-containing protein [Halomonas vilamensis]|uniref:EAL domain-containing protein n=1 Tax=Vreelandella vilamensis TaxID=531309 RepID=A0ABU1H6J9_9GAMM|nr:EAL domain-containing protein [Halomonas vilamensis]MDR5899307.1 EAL domain-containing protein [Halomonas vilamensis]